jgi:hypothetical protein
MPLFCFSFAKRTRERGQVQHPGYMCSDRSSGYYTGGYAGADRWVKHAADGTKPTQSDATKPERPGWAFRVQITVHLMGFLRLEHLRAPVC